jgi:hypothetical protein
MNQAPEPARLAVVMVNWNRWPDTIECLESLMRSTIPLKVIVVDNASADHSGEQIIAWAEGQLEAKVASPAMAHHIRPPIVKPVTTVRLSAEDIPAFSPGAGACSAPSNAQLSLIDGGGNLGFAGGNNLGIRLALSDPAIDHVWLLNNDTIVAPETAAKLLAVLDGTPNVGQCGTTVRYYYAPDRVQALCGSRFQPLTGRSWGIGMNSAASDKINAADFVTKTDFILGASLTVSRAFLNRVGLMEERYFLYFEEIDWAVRNRRLPGGPLATAYAPDAIVWHKEGGSIGSSGTKDARSKLSDYWLNRSRLSFTAKHFPLLLPLHWALTIAYIIRHILNGRVSHALNLIRALFRRPFSA